MMHKWLLATDEPGNTIRTVLFDFRKAFDLLDHNRLITKLKSLDLPSSTINWIIDFLIDRKQRVKLTSNCYSEWGQVRSGVPQGTKLGPWLYMLMINDLTTTRTKPWKYVDDTTLSEVIHKGKPSSIQEPVDEVQEWTRSNLAELNEDKCKELRIDFSRKQTQTNNLNPIRVNGKEIEVVNHAKILGLTVSSDCKWKMHVDNILSKASKRLYLITQLKRARVPANEIIQIYCSCIRPLLEYASPVFHNSLPQYLNLDIERVQKRCIKRIFPDVSYEEGLKLAKLETLCDRGSEACKKLFLQAYSDTSHKLHNLIPKENSCQYSLRRSRKILVPRTRTDRFKNSFVISNSSNM